MTPKHISPRCVQLANDSYVRADIIVSVYVENDHPKHHVKIRCQPNPFTWNPIVATLTTPAEAQATADQLARALWSQGDFS